MALPLRPAARATSPAKGEETLLSTAREAEHSLGDDVALDLGAPGVDRLGLRPEPPELPAALLQRPRRVRRERSEGPFERNRGVLDPLIHLAPVELGQARLGPR